LRSRGWRRERRGAKGGRKERGERREEKTKRERDAKDGGGKLNLDLSLICYSVNMSIQGYISSDPAESEEQYDGFTRPHTKSIWVHSKACLH
jgi:hypothetical protein